MHESGTRASGTSFVLKDKFKQQITTNKIKIGTGGGVK
jgi:hypothetical protein